MLLKDSCGKKINMNLIVSLEQIKGTIEKKLERMGDVLYQYGMEWFGVQVKKGRTQAPVVLTSRRQQEIKLLVRERRQLKKQ